MTSIQELKSAGFSNDEINAYMSQERLTLQEAGFGDDEISTHFGEQPFDLKESITGVPPEPPKEIKEPKVDEQLFGLPEGAGKPISTITGKPMPTPEEEFAGGRAAMMLIPHAFAAFTRGAIPEALETAIMEPVTKLMTGHSYISPITEAKRVSGELLPKPAREAMGVPAQMAGIVVPLSVFFLLSFALF